MNEVKNGHGSRNSTDSRKGVGQTAYKCRLAYDYLGIDPTDVEPVPFLRTNLRRIARCINQGRARNGMMRPLDYLLSSADPEARKVADAYISVPESYRRLLPAEAFCHAAGVSPYRVLELIAGTAIRMGALASAVVAAASLPNVMINTIKRALQDTGVKERTMLLRAAGRSRFG
jgi:hypothetical protein